MDGIAEEAIKDLLRDYIQKAWYVESDTSSNLGKSARDLIRDVERRGAVFGLRPTDIEALVPDYIAEAADTDEPRSAEDRS